MMKVVIFALGDLKVVLVSHEIYGTLSISATSAISLGLNQSIRQGDPLNLDSTSWSRLINLVEGSLKLWQYNDSHYSDNLCVKRSIPIVCFAHMVLNLRHETLHSFGESYIRLQVIISYKQTCQLLTKNTYNTLVDNTYNTIRLGIFWSNCPLEIAK